MITVGFSERTQRQRKGNNCYIACPARHNKMHNTAREGQMYVQCNDADTITNNHHLDWFLG